mgnify:CR=1 FL=1
MKGKKKEKDFSEEIEENIDDLLMQAVSKFGAVS